MVTKYDKTFLYTDIRPLVKNTDIFHTYHLYVVRVQDRDAKFKAMREANIGVNVHYMPVYLHPYYQELGYKQGLCPVAEKEFNKILMLPLWVGLGSKEIQKITNSLL